MTDQYTPSIKQLREDWISLMITSDGYHDALTKEMAEAQWDRALAAHDAEVRAEAWDEGYRAGGSYTRRAWSDEPGLAEPSNPYRSAQNHTDGSK